MGFDGDGALYGIGGGSSSQIEGLYSIDPATGASTYIADVSGISTPGTHGGIQNSPNQLRFIGDTAYTTTISSTSDGLYTINLTTGVGTLIGSTGLVGNNVLDAYIGGQFVDVSAGRIFLIDPATGNATTGVAISSNVTTTGGGYFAFATEDSVPEPAPTMLLGLGLSALSWTSSRRSAVSLP